MTMLIDQAEMMAHSMAHETRIDKSNSQGWKHSRSATDSTTRLSRIVPVVVEMRFRRRQPVSTLPTHSQA